MKKLFLVILLVVMASAMLLAQVVQGTNPTTKNGPGSVAPTVDVLGAHQNYGRGCAGCHAPHSGAWGAGGNGLTNTVTDTYTGINALFAQDMGPLWGRTFDFSDVSNTGSGNKYEFVTAANGNPTAMTAQQYSDMRGAVMCLACHDGAVAKGAMMQNWAYEEQIQALPSSYGTGKIPTLLGADGTTNVGSSTGGDYNNDHPIGENATISAVMGSFYGDASNGLVYTISTASKVTGIAAHGQYQQFVTSYGYPALAGVAHGTNLSFGTPVNAAGVPYILCTTCHDQHSMNVYAATATSPIAGNTSGTYAKYFFINGPYNPDTVSIPLGTAASTTQFCRQCHFGESNEANGGTLPTTF